MHINIRKKCEYQQFKKGNVKNPYDKTVCGIGYYGLGEYNFKKDKIAFKTWCHFLERCYSEILKKKRPTYKDSIASEEWHCFQNFAEWWCDNLYNCDGEKLVLDKDILVKGNKIYSPKTCLIVPERINSLFTKRDSERGKYPIGVSEFYDKRTNWKCLRVRCNTLKGSKYLGSFPLDKPFQAFYAYKIFKENYIKQVADEYYFKGLIPKKLYDAMYKYEVEIND